MFAIVEIAGHQYKVSPNAQIDVEKLDAEVGKSLKFNKVFLVSDEKGTDAKIGQPYVTGATVEAKVLEQYRGDKIIVHKFRPKKRYARTQGHRQSYTKLEITGIKA